MFFTSAKNLRVRHRAQEFISLSLLCRNVKTFSLKLNSRFIHRNSSRKPPWKVLFFGTDNFSVESLECLNKEKIAGYIKKLEVVTSVKSKANAVHSYADKNLLNVHNWPPQIQKDEFDFGVVVSFGHLIPKHIISQFPLGMLNVHASLLPRWRGAAPIVYAIMNGDKETGITVMQIEPHKFDIGGILKQAKLPIHPEATFSVIYKELASMGSRILLECIKNIPDCLNNIEEQPQEGISYAPRVLPSLAVVRWHEMSSIQVYNLYRALESNYPLSTKWHGTIIKLFHAEPLQPEIDNQEINVFLKTVFPGYVFYHKRTKLLCVKCSDNRWISFRYINVVGKKRMSAQDFHNGFISKYGKEKSYFE